MKIVTANEMRRIEDRSEAAGVSKDSLMERAGLESARTVRRLRNGAMQFTGGLL
ncbi:MAG: hypothetical protein OXG80_02295 [Chloroflexi bacterium]|nr:hypothetical protein [Chloroflexota bacterium]